MNLLAQLLQQPLATKPRARMKPADGRELAADIYGPHMRGKGLVRGKALRKLTGRSACAINCAMNKSLIPAGLVRKHLRSEGRREYYVFEWIGG